MKNAARGPLALNERSFGAMATYQHLNVLYLISPFLCVHHDEAVITPLRN